MVSYRLARQRTVDAYGRGAKTESEICDAQPELRRVAHACSKPLDEPCPICESSDLVTVIFAFGTGLPKSGRAVTTLQEIERFRASASPIRCYEVEVCRRCWWNHLRQAYSLGGSSA